MKGKIIMKTLKVMSIISFAVSLFCLICMVTFNNPIDYEAAIGWGVLLFLWTVALSIVTLVQSVKK